MFEEGTSWQTLGLKGDETVTIRGLAGDLKPRQTLDAEITSADGTRAGRAARSAASIRSTSSNTSATAASCTTCCAQLAA